MILTTSYQVAKGEIESELGIVSAEVVFGMNAFRDVLAGIRDFVGGRSGAMQTVLRDAREEALHEIEGEAEQLGADAVIALNLTYQQMSGMIMLAVNGTAVKLKKDQRAAAPGERQVRSAPRRRAAAGHPVGARHLAAVSRHSA